jgi:HEAT repeat protein
MTRASSLALAVAWGVALAAAPPARAQGGKFLGRSLLAWMEDLRKPDARVRRSAAFALGRLGDDAYIAAGELARRAVDDRDAGVREMSASAVGDIAVDFKGNLETLWEKVGADLVKALRQDTSPKVRCGAAYALGAFGKPAKEAVPVLKEALRDAEAGVRQNAAWALGRIGAGVDGAAVDSLCDLLRDPQALVRRDAAAALGALGHDRARAAARPLVELVKDEKDEVVRRSALDALAHLADKEHEGLAPELYPLLEGKDAETARAAAFVLVRMGERPAAKAVPVLRKALADPDPGVQALAAAALGSAGPKAAEAVLDLAKALNTSKDPVVRRNCVLALAKVGPEARTAVPDLAEALKRVPGAPSDPQRGKPYEEVREYAAYALAQIEYPANEKAIPAIREVIRDKRENPTLRQRCVWTLFKAKGEDLKGRKLDEVLAKVLEETGPGPAALLRYDSARLLAYALGNDAPDKTVDVLLEMLTNKGLLVYRGSGAEAQGIGDEARRGGTAVKEDVGGDARFMAAQALGWMKGKTKARPDAMRALREAAGDKDPKLSKAAKKALEDKE